MCWAFGCLKQQAEINWFGFDFCSCNSWIRVDCWQGVEVFIVELAIKEDQLEVLKTDVWTKLPQLNVEELEQVCTALDLTRKSGKEVCSLQCCSTALDVKHRGNDGN